MQSHHKWLLSLEENLSVLIGTPTPYIPKQIREEMSKIHTVVATLEHTVMKY